MRRPTKSPFHRPAMQTLEQLHAELGGRLKKHSLPNESADSIKAKLKRGTFAATFFLACLAALELEGVVLEEI